MPFITAEPQLLNKFILASLLEQASSVNLRVAHAVHWQSCSVGIPFLVQEKVAHENYKFFQIEVGG
jgi:hypothetical protein